MNLFKPTLACLVLIVSGAVSAETRLVLKSDSGDYIGQGKSYLYTDQCQLSLQQELRQRHHAQYRKR